MKNRFDIENSQYLALETQKNITILQVKSEVFYLLYKYEILKKRISLAQKRLNRLELVNKYLSTLVLTSPTKKAQWFITKDKIKLVERDLILYKNDLVQTWNSVNVFLNLEQEPLAINYEYLQENSYKGKSYYVEIAQENNLFLIEQKNLIKKFQSELSFAKIEKMPDFNISGYKESYSNSFGSGGNGNSSGVGVSLSIPLINQNNEKIIGASANLKAQQYLYDFQRDQLLRSLDNNLCNYETLLKVAKEFSLTNIGQIVLRLEMANDDFKKGVLDFITYMELDSQEYNVIDTIIETQINLAKSYSELMLKIGFFIIPTKH